MAKKSIKAKTATKTKKSKKKKRIRTSEHRNYSFANSKRLSTERMTEINGIRIPSIPGSCYHAIICALAEYKEQLVFWDRLFILTEKYIKQFGGMEAWDKFVDKDGIKSVHQRIKENTHTLTRTGKDCYGYRMHEQGYAIYFFKDGAILFIGGKLVKTKDGYNVKFPDGKGLQIRYRGTTMTSKEYKKFLELGYITSSGEILKPEKILKLRYDLSQQCNMKIKLDSRVQYLDVIINLVEDFDQNTAIRLEDLGLIVNDVKDTTIWGEAPSNKLVAIQKDKDVIHVSIDKTAKTDQHSSS